MASTHQIFEANPATVRDFRRVQLYLSTKYPELFLWQNEPIQVWKSSVFLTIQASDPMTSVSEVSRTIRSGSGWKDAGTMVGKT